MVRSVVLGPPTSDEYENVSLTSNASSLSASLVDAQAVDLVLRQNGAAWRIHSAGQCWIPPPKQESLFARLIKPFFDSIGQTRTSTLITGYVGFTSKALNRCAIAHCAGSQPRGL